MFPLEEVRSLVGGMIGSVARITKPVGERRCPRSEATAPEAPIGKLIPETTSSGKKLMLSEDYRSCGGGVKVELKPS